MGKIVEYNAVYASTSSYLTDKVNEAIQEGWQPLGSISVSVSRIGYGSTLAYSQAMVKYEE